ncbi:MAG: ADP-ribosylglycohydrolase family protein [Desulfobacterales bacterium]
MQCPCGFRRSSGALAPWGEIRRSVLASTGYESAVRNAISLGGDADTMACIAGGIAQAFYGAVPQQIARAVRSRLPEVFLDVRDRFESRYGSASVKA